MQSIVADREPPQHRSDLRVPILLQHPLHIAIGAECGLDLLRRRAEIGQQDFSRREALFIESPPARAGPILR